MPESIERRVSQSHDAGQQSNESFQRNPEEIIDNISSPALALAFARIPVPVQSNALLWQHAVFTIMQQTKAPELFEAIEFQENDAEPWSPQAGQFLNELGEAGVLVERFSVHHPPVLEMTVQGRKMIEEKFGFTFSQYPGEIYEASRSITGQLGVVVSKDQD